MAHTTSNLDNGIYDMQLDNGIQAQQDSCRAAQRCNFAVRKQAYDLSAHPQQNPYHMACAFLIFSISSLSRPWYASTNHCVHSTALFLWAWRTASGLFQSNLMAMRVGSVLPDGIQGPAGPQDRRLTVAVGRQRFLQRLF